MWYIVELKNTDVKLKKKEKKNSTFSSSLWEVSQITEKKENYFAKDVLGHPKYSSQSHMQ